GGDGYDRLIASDGDSLIGVSLLSSIEEIDGGDGYNILATDHYYGGTQTLDLRGTKLVNIDEIRGRDYADLIYGSESDDRIRGNGSSDTLYGMGGDDTFVVEGTAGGETYYYGGDGFDQIVGGDGDDLIEARILGSIERIDGGGGYNILSLGNYSAHPSMDLTNVAVQDINLLRGRWGYSSTIIGSAGDDTIQLGYGSSRDDATGGGGNDTYL